MLVLNEHCPNSLRPPPPLCRTGKRGKKCSKPSWQAFTPPLSGNAHGINTFQKGASLWGMTNPSIHSLEHIAHEAIYVSSVNRTNSENRVSGGSKVNSENTVNSVNSVLAAYSAVVPPSLMVILVVQDSHIVSWLAGLKPTKNQSPQILKDWLMRLMT